MADPNDPSEAPSSPPATHSSDQEQEQGSISKGIKRRRQSQRTAPSTTEQAESSSSTSRQTLKRASPQDDGNSRHTTMQRRSASPLEGSGSIKFTKTGRVSKATKGQRIHNCEECGKTYTRAEHLRRHQQNHKPGAFPCDVPGCTRSFYREDLLTRHKARHNDPLNPPSRRGSQSSAPGSERPRPAQASSASSAAPSNADQASTQVHRELNEAATAPPTQDNRQTTRAPKGYIPINELRSSAQAVSLQVDGPFSGYSLDSHWPAVATSPPYSSSGEYDSPAHDYPYSYGQPYYQQPPVRTRTSSNASFIGQWQPPITSRSPISASSSTIFWPQLVSGAQSPGLQYSSLSSSSGSSNCHLPSNHIYPLGGPIFLQGSYGVPPREMQPEERDEIERGDLLTPLTVESQAYSLPQESAVAATEQRYLDAYWQWFHPLFPVVYRPSFVLGNASPLLKAAMLALGAQYLADRSDVTNARILHERCLKCRNKRTLNSWHTLRTCDMQAIFLVEAYSIFRSRRPPQQFSKPFEDMYGYLAQDADALSPTTPMSNLNHALRYRDDPVAEVLEKHEAKCKQRLLVAYYILDQQHAVLFGRQRSTCAGIVGTDLPFPRSTQAWDARPEDQAAIGFQRRTANVPAYNYVYEAINGANALNDDAEHAWDAFRSLELLACVTGKESALDTTSNESSSLDDAAQLLFVMEQSPRVKLAYHTSMLCRNTPVRELLAVSGETWVLSEKLSNNNEYLAAQIETRTWANGTADSDAQIQSAVNHALQILDIVQGLSGKTGLLFEEWAIYLASLVLWARSYVATTERRQTPSLSIPSPQEPRATPHELEQTMRSMIRTSLLQSNIQIGRNQGKNTLLWTKERIARVDIPHNCGITNGALDVLGKLLLRGYEDGWF